MDKLIEMLLKSIQDGQWSVGAVVVIVAVVVNLRGILEYFERRGSRRENYVKEALKIELIKDSTRAFLEEELNYLVFRKITGISADRALREKIGALVDRSRGDLQPFQFARARKFIKLKDGKLTVSISTMDHIEKYFNWSAAILVAIFGVGNFILPVAVAKGAAFQYAFTSLVFGVLMVLFSVFLLSQTIPVAVAARIKPIVEKLEISACSCDAAAPATQATIHGSNAAPN
ncbi:hypothetical protein [Cupriavidus taiwanensis]|uniref:hypothetical protein n=1 Tax=Cupriavidus taiwanensis TaxID=164546 RepID=UPI000E2E6194|nr:hypothetical protein [Cupriavidus taiwanensis]